MVSEETLEYVGYYLQGQVCEWICNDVTVEHVFEWAGQKIGNDKDSACTHDLEETEVEMFPLYRHQKHIIHHNNTEDEQGDDYQLEKHTYEHAEVWHCW